LYSPSNEKKSAVGVGLVHEVILTFAGVAEEKIRLEDCRSDGLLPKTALRITPQSLSRYNKAVVAGAAQQLEKVDKIRWTLSCCG
jgi:hypothetical protein